MLLRDDNDLPLVYRDPTAIGFGYHSRPSTGGAGCNAEIDDGEREALEDDVGRVLEEFKRWLCLVIVVRMGLFEVLFLFARCC